MDWDLDKITYHLLYDSFEYNTRILPPGLLVFGHSRIATGLKLYILMNTLLSKQFNIDHLVKFRK